MTRRRPSVTRRIYGTLLICFPPEMRRQDGPEMARQFADRLADTRGISARAKLWALAIVDLVRHGLGARFDDRRVRQPAGRRDRQKQEQVMSRLALDLRYGWRAYAKTPGSTLVALAAIALGIGANTALFSYADALFLRPLPVSEPDRLYSLFHVTAKNDSYSSFSHPDFVEIRDQSQTLSGVAAWASIEVDLGRPVEDRVPAQIVSGNYFDVLGVTAAAGRVFHAAEDRTAGADAVAVISHMLWRRHFGADEGIVGRTIPLNGRDFTVVGVAPRAFRGVELASDPQLWVPLMMHRVAMPSFRAFNTELFGNRGTHWLDLTVRVAPDVPFERAVSELRAIADRQAAANPDTNKDWTITGLAARDGRLGPPGSRPVIRLTGLLLAVVGLMLAVVCANVANLLLARAAGRQQELAVRLALGASRSHVIRQLLAESSLLAGVGGLGGMLLAVGASTVLPSIDVTGSLPGLDPHINGRVLLFAVGLTLTTGVVFGLAPAIQASGTSLVGVLKPSARAGSGTRRWSLRQSFVALQVALTMVLLCGAALTLRTIHNLYMLPLGFNAAGVWIAPVDLTRHIDAADRGRAVQRDLVERVEALPGVTGAAFGFMTPFSGQRMANDFFWTPEDGGDRRRTNLDMNIVGSTYFRVMGIPMLRGRPFNEDDREGAPDVAIINRALAERLWPGTDAVGHSIWSWNPRGKDRELRIVGVIENGRYYRSWRSGTRPFLFVPAGQWYQGDMVLHAQGVSLSAATLRRIIQGEVPEAPPAAPIRLADAMSASMALEQTAARVLAAFGALALAIAAIGVYSVVTFSVGRQAHEIGIRMALGARRPRVVGAVIFFAMKPIIAGVALGWLTAIALSRFIASLLFGVPAADPATYAAAAIILALAGCAASFVPARRATQADPLQALRAM